MGKSVILLNYSAGSSRQVESDRVFYEAMRSVGLRPEIRHFKPGDLREAAREALEKGPEAVVAGGGDGTISAVASALAGTGVPLGVLPLGTLNHFAKDLGIPLGLHEAARLIARPSFRDIDIAEVNGRYFINNSSIGLYPKMVQIRDEQRSRSGRGKWPAMARAFLQVFRSFSCLTIRMQADAGITRRQTSFLLVGNNEYRFDLFTLGGRQTLDRGILSIYTVTGCGRFTLLWMALRAMAGRLDQGIDFEARTASDVWIDVRRPRIRTALDGEVAILSAPLHYRIHPGALRVIAPRKGE